MTPHAAHPAGRSRLEALRERLDAVRLIDRARLARELERLAARHSIADPTVAWARLEARVEASAAQVARLRALPLNVELDPTLPIAAHQAQIRRALELHSVIIVCGATGSGKSTQLPKLCLAAGRGARGMIAHTQPRRIAARALAARLAQELHSSVGAAVGFQVRFEERTGADCRVKLMTDGILLNELHSDRELQRYDTLIIDEVHERTLNIDLLLGVARQLLARRTELRIIVTSATIEPQKLAEFFGGAPIIEVSGRSHPVEVRYRPLLAADAEAAELTLPEGVTSAIRELSESGDVLVFLPGEKQIAEASEALSRARLADLEVLPLFARLSAETQQRIFAPHARRRVVLATNVAETSLTVPGIRHVVDSGLARISRYSVRAKVQRLPIERISRASAEQRTGRCGREAEGVCIRLYSQEDFAAREAFTAPEILRTNLASVILQMAVLDLGEPESFPFPDPPDTRLVNDGMRLLQELKAMDGARRVTRIGRQLATLPCDPRLGRMLLAAAHHGSLQELLVIASFLAVRDPRERPEEAQQLADAAHATHADARSDFMSVLALWRALTREAQMRSRRELSQWCRDAYLSFVRVREWQCVHGELAEAAGELGLAVNEQPASYSAVHRAIVTGLLGSVGVLDEGREYQGARGTRFVIAPGSTLAQRPPKWIVAASLIETTRLYARMVGAIEPAWIEAAAAHLVKRSYTEPHWSPARGHVVALESVSLYGLTLIARRRVNYGPVAPAEAHEIFIREVLVAERSELAAEFLRANRARRAQIERLEAKIRRRDILVDESAQVAFYRTRIPQNISSLAGFERWWTGERGRDPQRLHMQPGDLMRREAPEAGPEHFPDALDVNGNLLPLSYLFDLGAADDGVTLIVPELLVEDLDADRLAWLVPGLRPEKIAALLRALPKAVRKQLVPVPEYARAALDELTRELGAVPASMLPPAGFCAWMARWLARRTDTAPSASELAALPLPEPLRMNIRIVSSVAPGHAQEQAARAVIAEGRELAVLQRQLQSAHRRRVHTQPHELHREWDFGDLPESEQVEHAGARYCVYPALEDRQTGVARIAARSKLEAEFLTRAALTRLITLALARELNPLRKRIAQDRELVLLAQGLTLDRTLPDAIAERAVADCFLPAELPLPRHRDEFAALLERRGSGLHAAVGCVVECVRAILQAWRPARAELARVRPHLSAEVCADIEAQLAALLPADFITRTAEPWLAQLPRYLAALRRRLERLPAAAGRDAALARRIAPFTHAWHELAARRTHALAAPLLAQYRWMLEEFRVSLYAQELKTLMPVSEQRLAEQLERAKLASAAPYIPP